MRTLNEHESLSFKDHKATRYGPSPHPFWSGDGRYTNPFSTSLFGRLRRSINVGPMS
ncbi:hypothetical protein HanXRQr2_Chr17g0816251 [Helianthus annuus]|uniref:Uncharacterized protein n=1 Tax=Helianthus annuus TaxID=4232 RepID=A0A9K3DJI7_HELAN|nr:hypothetical protein HanXRQr2_Chr17g0816251 [Helianthus annuus]